LPWRQPRPRRPPPGAHRHRAPCGSRSPAWQHSPWLASAACPPPQALLHTADLQYHILQAPRLHAGDIQGPASAVQAWESVRAAAAAVREGTPRASPGVRRYPVRTIRPRRPLPCSGPCSATPQALMHSNTMHSHARQPCTSTGFSSLRMQTHLRRGAWRGVVLVQVSRGDGVQRALHVRDCIHWWVNRPPFLFQALATPSMPCSAKRAMAPTQHAP
jgi:hypothetical protein